VHIVSDDQGDAAQVVRLRPQPAEQASGRSRLSSGEPKGAGGVAVDDEIHPRAAEIAFPVEDDHPV